MRREIGMCNVQNMKGRCGTCELRRHKIRFFFVPFIRWVDMCWFVCVECESKQSSDDNVMMRGSNDDNDVDIKYFTNFRRECVCDNVFYVLSHLKCVRHEQPTIPLNASSDDGCVGTLNIWVVLLPFNCDNDTLAADRPHKNIYDISELKRKP